MLGGIGKALGIGGKSKSKSNKVEESANDRALADISKRQHQRYEWRYAPLMNELNNESYKTREDTFRGRANADVMAGISGEAGRTPAGRSRSLERGATGSLGGGLTGGTNQDTERRKGIMNTVSDAALGSNQQAYKGMITSSNVATSNAISGAQSAMDRGNQSLNVLGTGIGAASNVLGGEDGIGSLFGGGGEGGGGGIASLFGGGGAAAAGGGGSTAGMTSSGFIAPGFASGGGAAGGGSAAGSAGSAAGGMGPWGWLAAAVVGNEVAATDAGRRDSNTASYLTDLASGAVLEQDMDYYGDKIGGVGGDFVKFMGKQGNPEGVWDSLKSGFRKLGDIF